jgi:hypothetical protein
MSRIKGWITYNFWLKALSLILAVVTWSYVTWQLEKAEEKEKHAKSDEQWAMFNIIHYDFAAKKLPIAAAITGAAQDGYEVAATGITVSPAECVIIGPKNVLREVASAKTAPVDISGSSADIDRCVSLAPIRGGITVKEEFVTVHVPIRKK